MAFASPLSSTNDDYPLSDSEFETEEDATEDEDDARQQQHHHQQQQQQQRSHHRRQDSYDSINYLCVCGKRIDLSEVSSLPFDRASKILTDSTTTSRTHTGSGTRKRREATDGALVGECEPEDTRVHLPKELSSRFVDLLFE